MATHDSDRHPAYGSARPTGYGADQPTPRPPPAQGVWDGPSRAPDGWGTVSRVACVIGGLIAMWGGVSLLAVKAVGNNSLMEAIANGLGAYCLGKGIFMIAIAVNFKAAVQAIRRV